MRNGTRYLVACSLVVFLASAALGLGQASARAQELAPGAVSVDHARALRVIADYSVSRLDNAGRLLASYGYTPPVGREVWNHYPAVRKVEAAYAAAEAAAPNRGGAHLLALLSRDLAQLYDSIRHNSTLQPYLQTTPSDDIRFANPAITAFTGRISSEHRAALAVISDYASGGPFGSPRFIMYHYFGLSPDRAYQILASSSSHKEALEKAFAETRVENRDGILRLLVGSIAEHYGAAYYERAFAPYLSPLSKDDRAAVGGPFGDGGGPFGGGGGPSGDGTGPVAPPPRPGPGGGSPAPSSYDSSSVERYKTYVNSEYGEMRSAGEGGGLPFRSMIVRVGGFGGVIFGNSVRRAPELPVIKSISIDLNANRRSADVIVNFANASSTRLRAIDLEDIFAAYQMTLSRSPAVPTIKLGNGVGLAGVMDRSPLVRRNAEGVPVCRTGAAKFNVIIHPALANLGLGTAAIMADASPIARNFIPELVEKRVKVAFREDTLALLESMGTEGGSLGTWKIVDVPLLISLAGTDLVFERDPRESSQPIGLRRSCFIELRPLIATSRAAALFGVAESAEYDRVFADSFYQFLPVILKASDDYSRLNRFAPLLALFRLAASDGAVMDAPSFYLQTKETARALEIDDNNIQAIPRFDPKREPDDVDEDALRKCEVGSQ